MTGLGLLQGRVKTGEEQTAGVLCRRLPNQFIAGTVLAAPQLEHVHRCPSLQIMSLITNDSVSTQPMHMLLCVSINCRLFLIQCQCWLSEYYLGDNR